jgi:hypothetical protein
MTSAADILGLAGLLFGAVRVLPQTAKTLRSKSSGNLSALFFLCHLVAGACGLTYELSGAHASPPHLAFFVMVVGTNSVQLLYMLHLRRARAQRWLATAGMGVALLLGTARSARAENDEPAVAAAVAPPGPWLAHASLSAVGLVVLGPTATAPATMQHAGQSLSLGQQLGVGYFVTPRVRVTLTALLSERVTPDRSYGMLGVTPTVSYMVRPFFVGVGPIVSFVNRGTPSMDAGVIAVLGAAIPVTPSVAVTLSANVPALFGLPSGSRFSLAVAPGVGVGYRF